MKIGEAVMSWVRFAAVWPNPAHLGARIDASHPLPCGISATGRVRRTGKAPPQIERRQERERPLEVDVIIPRRSTMAERGNETDQDEGGPERRKPDSTGPNARPSNDTISQTGPGIPDDTSRPVEIDPDEEKRIEESIRSL
jgi:hypothetical protein